MELKTFLTSTAVAIIGAAIGGICKTELEAWLPRGAKLLCRIAVLQMPPDLRSRYQEEWSAYLDDMPGPLSKVWAALGLMWAGISMGVEARILWLKILFYVRVGNISNAWLEVSASRFEQSLTDRNIGPDGSEATEGDIRTVMALKSWSKFNVRVVVKAQYALNKLKVAIGDD